MQGARKSLENFELLAAKLPIPGRDSARGGAR
jgi:hypothetical protein